MAIHRFGPLLAMGGAACLIAWTPQGRPPPHKVAALGRPSAARFDAAPEETASIARPAQSARDANLAALSGQAQERVVGLEALPLALRRQSAGVPASPPEAARSEAGAKVQLAYADITGAAPALGAPSAIASSAPKVAALEPPAAWSGPEASPPEPEAESAPPSISPPLSQAAILYTKGDAAGLAALAAQASDPARRTALEWASLRADAHPSFAALGAFLKAHPDWPSRNWIRARREADLLVHPLAPAEVAAFFADAPPLSSAGKIAAARAALATGRADEASRIIRDLWRDGNFDGFTESLILRDFAALLTKADHAYRAERLIYAGYDSAGVRAAALAGPEFMALADARIVAARAPMNPALIRAVPPALRNDPGLLFSRIQYARRAGRVYEAAVLLSLAPRDRDALVNRDRWWSERKMVARALLDLDEPRLAFEVCDQTVRPDTSEAEVDADFHAGWIALRFLHEPALAAERFARAAKAAENPLSVARAAYWRGRAAEAMGEAEAAKTFYARAASVPIAYYGQLAAKRLGETRLALSAPPPAAKGDGRDEAVLAAEALYADGLDALAAQLAFDAARRWRDDSQLAAMGEVVKRQHDPGTEVQFAKIAVIRGRPFDTMAFPAVGMPGFVPLPHSADLPTVYAVARQESEFIWRSASWAGAKGLMQMLPSTAAQVARRAGVEFDPARLVVDPAFNTELGAALLGQLIEDEGGSRPLAFAAYNAGPGRVAQWIAAHGDPRNGSVDLVDWIERIPFDETRDYVERVSENLAVYRQRFADEKPAQPPVSARLARQ